MGIIITFRAIFRNCGRERYMAGKKGKETRCFEGFEQTLCRFDMQTDRAVFPYTIMIDVTGGQISGKNNRKGHAGRQDGKQHPFFATRFHTRILPGSGFPGKRDKTKI